MDNQDSLYCFSLQILYFHFLCVYVWYAWSNLLTFIYFVTFSFMDIVKYGVDG
jgi:hypothetical protein